MNKGNLPPKELGAATAKNLNTFFKDSPNTSSNIDDAVVGYFEILTGDKEAGRTLAATVLHTALARGLPPMSIVDEFRKLPPQELNAYLTMFLNLNRSNSSLLGLTNSPTLNKYVKRTILA